MSYKKSAEDILQAIGGEENLDAIAHCATRLRLVLNDESKVDEETLNNMDVVKGTFSTGGQYQIIIGSGTVNKVFNELEKITGKEASTTSDVKDKSTKNMNPLQKFVKMLSDIFVPIIPAIVAGGLLMGLNNILTAKDLFYKGQSFIDVHSQFAGLAEMINVFANAPFTLLPILIGFSAAKRFGGNPFLGAALGMILVHPSLMSAYDFPKAVEAGKAIPHWDIFGLHINQVGYQGQVLPMLVAAYILATIEKWLRKVIPTVLDNLLTVSENLRFRASLYGIIGNEFENRLEEVANQLDFKNYLNQPFHTLSGGQKRRVEIARAIFHEPKILLLDEPTTGLDPESRKTVWEIIGTLKNNFGMTIFLTTHYLEEARNSDLITVINQGRIVATGTAIALQKKYSCDRLFLYPYKETMEQLITSVKNVPLSYKISDDHLIIEDPSIGNVREILKYDSLIDSFEYFKGNLDDAFINILKQTGDSV